MDGLTWNPTLQSLRSSSLNHQYRWSPQRGDRPCGVHTIRESWIGLMKRRWGGRWVDLTGLRYLIVSFGQVTAKREKGVGLMGEG
jgi:hypothetical protein